MNVRYGDENLRKLVNASGIGLGTLHRIKSNKTSVGLDMIARIAEALSVDPWQLLCPPELLQPGRSSKAYAIGEHFDTITNKARRAKAYALVTAVIDIMADPEPAEYSKEALTVAKIIDSIKDPKSRAELSESLRIIAQHGAGVIKKPIQDDEAS